MKGFAKSLGNAVIILIVGISPMGIGAVMTAFADTEYAGVIMNLFILAGSLLSLYVMKKQFGINISDNAAKPPMIPALLIAAAALLYEISALLTVYKPLTSVGYSGMSALDVIEWISAVFVGSAAEELIFRFGILSLLAGEKGRFPRNDAAVILTSLMWSVIHFPDSLPRFFDLMIAGILLGYIFLKYGNILLCILFHALLNFIAGLPEDLLAGRFEILYISLPLCLLFTAAVIFSKPHLKSPVT